LHEDLVYPLAGRADHARDVALSQAERDRDASLAVRLAVGIGEGDELPGDHAVDVQRAERLYLLDRDSEPSGEHTKQVAREHGHVVDKLVETAPVEPEEDAVL